MGPMIYEFSKISYAFKKLTIRIETLEKSHQEDAKMIKMLEKRNDLLEKKVEDLEKELLFVTRKFTDIQSK